MDEKVPFFDLAYPEVRLSQLGRGSAGGKVEMGQIAQNGAPKSQEKSGKKGVDKWS